jgi:hypothetical protein
VSCFRNFFGANGEAINKLQIRVKMELGCDLALRRWIEQSCQSRSDIDAKGIVDSELQPRSLAAAWLFASLWGAAAIDRSYRHFNCTKSSSGTETQAIPA